MGRPRRLQLIIFLLLLVERKVGPADSLALEGQSLPWGLLWRSLRRFLGTWASIENFVVIFGRCEARAGGRSTCVKDVASHGTVEALSSVGALFEKLAGFVIADDKPHA